MGLLSGKRAVLLLSFLIVLDLIRVGQSKREEDYYEVLGVARDTDEAMIRRVWRKKGQQYHPDNNPTDPDAAEKFAKIREAYEVLSNPEKREIYDMYGKEGLSEDGMGMGMRMNMYGGQQRRRQREKRHGMSIVVPVFTSLEQLYKGDVIEAAHKKQVICAQWEDCETTCTRCGGSGIVIQTMQIQPGFIQQMQSACPKCGGRGKISTGKCRGCPHGQFEQAERSLLVDIERGMPDGNTINFPEEADEQEDHIPGDVQFMIRTSSHDRFERRGDDLYHKMNISLLEALVGVDREVEQLDGRQVRIQKDNVTSPHELLYIDGEGMPFFRRNGFGKMIVEFWVEFPESVTDDQKSLMEQVFGSGLKAGSVAAAAAVGDVIVEHKEL